MKKLVLLSFCVLFSAAIANAGVFRVGSKVVEGSAKLAYQTAKPSVKLSAKAVKPAAKVASYPMRHPKKTARGIKKAAD